jgi:hypothetical protein
MEMYNGNENPEPPPVRGGKGFAIASMVLGIVAIVLCCCVYYVALPCAVVGLVLGAVSLKQQRDGRGMAIAGVVTGLIALALAFFMIIALAVFITNLPWLDLF